jgi:hypothetical protein
MKKVLLTLGALALTSFSAKASIDSLVNEYSYDLMSQNVSDVTSGNAININDVNVSISSFSYSEYQISEEWSVKCGYKNCYWDRDSKSLTETNTIDTAETAFVTDWGYAVKNDAEATGEHQTIDNFKEVTRSYRNNGWNKTVDKFRTFEYLLFSFDEGVNLTDIDFGWNNGGDDQQVSVVSLNNASALTSDSWDKLVTNETTLNAVSKSFKITGGQYDGTVQLTGFETTYSNYWLVGAYNKAFGDIGGKDYNDAFKISGVQFNTLKSIKEPPPKVSEPGILFIMSIGAGIALYRRRRSD